MKRRIVGLLMAAVIGCVSLTACAGSDDAEKNAQSTESAEKAGSVEKDNLSGDSTVIAVGNTNVTFDEYNAYKYIMMEGYENKLGVELWNYSIDGKTIGQMSIEDCLRMIIQIKVMNKVAAQNNITLDIDEKADVDHFAQTYFDKIPEDKRKENGITIDTFQKIFEENSISRKLYDVESAKAVAGVNAEELHGVLALLIKLPKTAENAAEVKAQADALVAEYPKFKGNAVKFAKEKTGSAPSEEIVGTRDERTTLAAAVIGMKAGDVSGVIEEKDADYIAFCLETGETVDENYRSNVLAEIQSKAFETQYENWAKKYEVRVSNALL